MDYASRWLRFFAWIIDGVVIAIVMFILWLAGLVGADSVEGFGASDGLVNALVTLVYYVAMTAAFGATLGKMALGMRVADADGNRPGFGAVVMREVVGKIVSALVILIGFFWILVDDRRQGWHDKIGGTFVVKAK